MCTNITRVFVRSSVQPGFARSDHELCTVGCGLASSLRAPIGQSGNWIRDDGALGLSRRGSLADQTELCDLRFHCRRRRHQGTNCLLYLCPYPMMGVTSRGVDKATRAFPRSPELPSLENKESCPTWERRIVYNPSSWIP